MAGWCAPSERAALLEEHSHPATRSSALHKQDARGTHTAPQHLALNTALRICGPPRPRHATPQRARPGSRVGVGRCGQAPRVAEGIRGLAPQVPARPCHTTCRRRPGKPLGFTTRPAAWQAQGTRPPPAGSARPLPASPGPALHAPGRPSPAAASRPYRHRQRPVAGRDHHVGVRVGKLPIFHVARFQRHLPVAGAPGASGAHFRRRGGCSGALARGTAGSQRPTPGTRGRPGRAV